MPLPTDDLIIWASSDVNLPNLAGPNKVKPIDDLILKGWDFKQKPAADEFNYVLNNMGQYISYLNEDMTYTFSGDVTGSVTSSGSEDINFNISVNDNSHNHTSANISDATSLNTPNMVVRRDTNGDVAVRYVVGELTGNALTATTLKTPRTINGTSFNGSSNITTNSWGASRTFTVNGATTGSVSVDGSSNITLTTTLQTLGSNIGILTGTLASGNTIPLPSGYTEEQCKWMASLAGVDIPNDISALYVSVSGRVVTIITDEPIKSGSFHYIIIGVK